MGVCWCAFVEVFARVADRGHEGRRDPRQNTSDLEGDAAEREPAGEPAWDGLQDDKASSWGA